MVRDSSPDAAPRRRRSWLLWSELAALCALLVLWASGASRPPTLEWHVAGASSNEPFQRVAAEASLSLSLDLPAETWVYVASHEPVRGNIAMFPSAYLLAGTTRNPVPAGRHTLPGRHADVTLEWHAGDVAGPISFFVIASARPIPELDAAMASFRQMGNAAFPNRARLGTYAPKGGMERVPPLGEIATGVLRAANTLLDDGTPGPMLPLDGHPGVFARVLRLQVDAPSGDESLEARIRASIGKPLERVESAAPTGR